MAGGTLLPTRGKALGNSQGFSLSVFVLLITVLCHGLAVMAVLTQRLPVLFIPEQSVIPTVRHNMIHHSCLHQSSLFPALDTQGVCFQEPASCDTPSSVVPTPGRRYPVTTMQRSMLFTIIPVCQLRASRMAAGLLWLHRHFIHLLSYVPDRVKG